MNHHVLLYAYQVQYYGEYIYTCTELHEQSKCTESTGGNQLRIIVTAWLKYNVGQKNL